MDMERRVRLLTKHVDNLEKEIQESDNMDRVNASVFVLIGMNRVLLTSDPEDKELWEISERIQKLIEFGKERSQDNKDSNMSKEEVKEEVTG